MSASSPQLAREKVGLSLHHAARRARISASYLRRIERHGGTPYILAVRLAHLYQCSIHVFI